MNNATTMGHAMDNVVTNLRQQSTAPSSRYAEHAGLLDVFEKQKLAFLDEPNPSCEQRIADLNTLKRMLAENRDALTAAIAADYGCRSWHETTFAEFISVLGGIAYMKNRLKRWMKPQKRHVDIALFPGGRNVVTPQPLGVVGIIVPWNFPINLSMIPVATALAAGNRVMVKMSENSRNLARVLNDILPNYFPVEKLAIFDETGGVGVEFSTFPFDLLMFTGSAQTGKAVMAAAAKNLTPVLLELGGKCPAIIDADYSLEKAVRRIFYAKQFNAGQVCLNVDYVFVPEGQRDQFIELAKTWARALVPDISSDDFTSIIDDRSYDRLEETLRDAQSKGATVINLTGQAGLRDQRKFPLHLVLDADETMQISHRETFGPVLLVKTYRTSYEVIQYVNARPRPLALYVFSENQRQVKTWLSHIMSGGVTVNDTMMHVFQDDMPFGGVGHSGMGHYHGHEGFLSFSKLRPVYYQPKFNAFGLLEPPYPAWLTKAYNLLVKLKS